MDDNKKDNHFYSLIPRQKVDEHGKEESILQNDPALSRYRLMLLQRCSYETGSYELGTEQERILFLKQQFILKNAGIGNQQASMVLKILLSEQNILFFSGNPFFRDEYINKKYWIEKRKHHRIFYDSRWKENWISAIMWSFSQYILDVLAKQSGLDQATREEERHRIISKCENLLRAILAENKKLYQ